VERLAVLDKDMKVVEFKGKLQPPTASHSDSDRVTLHVKLITTGQLAAPVEIKLQEPN
jgi:hypothetical protein